MRHAFLALGALLLFIAPGRAHAATINVSPGDGTLQAALDAAQDGDVLVLKAGVYTGGGTRSDLNNLTIRGKGKVIIEGAATDANPEPPEIGLSFTNVQGLTLEGLTIRNFSDDCIHLYTCSQFSMSRCRIEDASDSGIEERGTVGYSVDRCTFVRCSYALALGYTTGSSNVTVQRCKFIDTTSYSIDLFSDNALITKNSFRGGAGTAIYIDGADEFSGTQVSKNKIKKIGGDGIFVDGNSNCTISGNRIGSTGRDGIVVTDSAGTDNTIQGNAIKKAGRYGIRVANSRNTYTGNRASRSAEYDLYSEPSESQNTYTDNRFGTTIYDQN